MTKLRISPELSLPIEAVTEAIGFLGRRGSGKSYAAQKLAEEFHRAGAQFIVLDPVGNWWALRLAANGKDPGLPIHVLGGLQGDVPIEPTGGKLVADTIVDSGISAVLDVSQFESDADKARFARAFCERFYFRKKSAPSAVHVFLEEAQEFIPQNPARGGKDEANESHMLHAFTRLAKLGRNFGIGISMLSQRPQEVNKKVLNLCELLFAFQLTGSHERKAMESWIGDKGIEGEDLEAELPKLERGHPHVWSPAWLKVSKVIEIGPKWTFDASSTPKVGAVTVVRDLSPINLDKLRKDMAASIEKAKADDPKELRREIAALKKQLATGPMKSIEKAAKPVTVVDHAAIDRAVSRAVATAVKPYGDRMAQIKRAVTVVAGASTKLRDAIGGLAAIDFDVTLPTNGNGSGNGNGHRAPSAPRAPIAPIRASRPVSRAAESSRVEGVTGVEQRILNTLKALEDMGVTPIDKPTAAALVGYHPRAKGYANALGALRTAGRIDYPSSGQVALTDDGRAISESQLSIASVEDLHRIWFDRLGNIAQRILEPVIEAYRNGERAVDADWLAEQAGYHPRAKGFANAKGRLRTLGLINYPSPGKVIATKVLFPEGLY